MKRYISWVLVLAMLFSLLPLSAFAVEVDVDTGNDYVDFDLCGLCGETYIPATCTAPSYCPGCGTTGNPPLGHEWDDDSDGVTLGVCLRCGEPEVPDFEVCPCDLIQRVPASCTVPEHCPNCGTTYGSALGHDWSDSVPSTCNRCGEINETIVASGTCGENLTWKLDDAGKLTISGTGTMDNWYHHYEASGYYEAPWYFETVRTVVVEDGITNIGNYAFYGCTDLTSVSIPDSVISIGNSAFEDCNDLIGVTIPDSITSIGNYAFYGCTSLTSITIPDSVTRIGNGVFASCTRLTNITIPNSVTSIGDSAFFGCNRMQYNIYSGGKYLGNNENPYIYLAGTTSNYITCFEIHGDTKFIGSGAFALCSKLTTIMIPDRVIRIGTSVFRECESLTGIWVSENNTAYSSDEYGVLYNKNKTKLICVPGDISGTYTVPNSVINIGSYAFEYRSGLTSVVIPETVRVLGESVFYDCKNLESIFFQGQAFDYDGIWERDNSSAYNCGHNDPNFDLDGDLVLDLGDPFFCEVCNSSSGPLSFINPNVIIYIPAGDSTWDEHVEKGTWVNWQRYDYAPAQVERLEITTLPAKCSYVTGGTLDLTGMVVLAHYSDGRQVAISAEKVTAQADMTTAGKKTATVTYQGASASFEIYVHIGGIQVVDSSLYPQSSHDYSNNMNQTKTLTVPGATQLILTFNSSSATESNYDYVYVLDGNGIEIAKYTGSFGGRVVTVPGDTVKIKLTSDGSVVKYGYAFSKIEAELGIEHPELIVPGYPSTCIQSGMSDGAVCAICGQLLIPQRELELGEHTWQAATCTQPKTCTVCGATEGAPEHSGNTWITIIDPTCLEEGLKARICDVCGETETAPIPAMGHGYVGIVTPPTCTEKGFTTNTCSVCGDVTITDYTDTVPHSYESVVTAPSCTEGGYTTNTCSVCGDVTITDYTDTVPHSYESVVTAPSCTEGGYTTNTYVVCGEVTVTDGVEALGHQYTSVIIAPTCTEEGYTTNTCSVCGDVTITDPVPAKGHKWSAWIQTKAPTCATEGSRLRFCNCGTKETESIPMLEHTWSEWIQTQDPTCTQEGTLSRTCTCGASEIESIPMLDHTYVDEFCTVCGASEYEIIASGDYGRSIQWRLNSNGTLFIFGTGAMAELPYTSIPWRNNYVKKVIIDDGVTSVCTYAFYGCRDLTAVSIPTSVTSIGADAFKYCSSLTTVTIPDSVISIGAYAFCDCTALASVNIPANISSIDDYAFSGCINLAEIRFDATNMNDLGSVNYVFYKCGASSSGIQVTIGANVEKIPKCLFRPNSGSSAPKLLSVVFEEGSVCTSIGDDAFKYCSSLTTVTIPDSVTSIGSSAFSGCTGLTSVTYCGTEEQWNQISIGKYNTALTSAVRNYHNWNDAVCEKDKLCTICGEIGGQWPHTYANGVCSACGILESSNWALTADAVVDISLTEDLYIDLNGYDLSGSIALNGHKVYGKDSATDDYTNANMGYFTCVDENGNGIIPESFHTTEDNKRYMTIETENGYTFHRFYLGITHVTLKPNDTGFGYKAQFRGDEMVRSEVASIGYNLWLTEGCVVSRTAAFKNTLTLRLKNFDVVNYGEAPVNACVSMTLLDGTVLKSATASYSMRQMVEQINDTTQNYQRATLQNVALMILEKPPMETWQVENILASLRPEATVSELTVVNENMKLYDAWGKLSGNETVTLDAAYIFDAQDTVEVAMAGPYAKWLADYYISIDSVVQDGLCLAGNYDGWGWISYEVPSGEQYQDYGLLTNSIGAITYTEVVRDVNRFSCGFADTLNANAGATITVQLRLTNPEDPNETIVINTITLSL